MGFPTENLEDEDERTELLTITPASVFQSEDPSQEAKSTNAESSVPSFYTEHDSDNESSSDADDFKPIYKQKKDDFRDLKLLDKPVFLADLL